LIKLGNTKPVKRAIETDVSDLKIVESNLQKLQGEMEEGMSFESRGGSAGTYQEGDTIYPCVGANAVIDSKTGKLVYFYIHHAKKLEDNETKIT
jgi:hypothetical protein